MIMNKISVFGSGGFIGSRFCEMFPNDVIKIPRDSREPETNNILNFISTTHNYHMYNDIFKDINTNVIIMLEILERANIRFGTNFIFNQVSTWSVYGNVDLPVNENSYCNPTGFYSITKRTAEQLLIAYCKVFGVSYRVLRLCNVLGETDKIIPKKKNALQYLINELKNNRDINLYNNGEFLREYMYVDDICEGIHLCIEKGDGNDIYNIGSGEMQVFGEMIDYCIKKLNSTSKVNRINPSGFHNIVQARDMFLDTSKLVKLGFKPEHNIYETLNIIMRNEYIEHD
jgi:nucleoside-diphosphate-sugar epimerase